MIKVIDTHPHVASNDTQRYPISPLGEKRSDWSADHSVTTAELIRAMDAAGVSQAALVHSSTTYGFNCDYVAGAVAAFPDRLTGVFSINVLAEDAVERMREWFLKGLTGMRIYVKGTTVKQAWLALDDPRLRPVYASAADLGITVALNTKASDGFDQLETVLRNFPDVQFLLDHAGRADFGGSDPFAEAEPLLRLARYPNLNLKITSVNFLKGQGWENPVPVLSRLVSTFGADHLAWGSNYPASSGGLAELLGMAIHACEALSTQEQSLIFSGTAARLYPALASHPDAAGTLSPRSAMG